MSKYEDPKYIYKDSNSLFSYILGNKIYFYFEYLVSSHQSRFEMYLLSLMLISRATYYKIRNLS